jgi:hypothetical protein
LLIGENCIVRDRANSLLESNKRLFIAVEQVEGPAFAVVGSNVVEI